MPTLPPTGLVPSLQTASRSLLLLLMITTTGCGDKKAVVEPEELRVMRASIDGIDFLGANELYAQHVNGILAIAARDSDGRTIHLTVLNDFSTGDADIGPGHGNSAVTALNDAFWRSNISGGEGVVHLTKVGAFGAEGTFSFTAMAVPNTKATGKRTVTGRFNVEYQLAAGSIFGRNAVHFASLTGHAPHYLRSTVNWN